MKEWLQNCPDQFPEYLDGTSSNHNPVIGLSRIDTLQNVTDILRFFQELFLIFSQCGFWWTSHDRNRVYTFLHDRCPAIWNQTSLRWRCSGKRLTKIKKLKGRYLSLMSPSPIDKVYDHFAFPNTRKFWLVMVSVVSQYPTLVKHSLSSLFQDLR